MVKAIKVSKKALEQKRKELILKINQLSETECEEVLKLIYPANPLPVSSNSQQSEQRQ